MSLPRDDEFYLSGDPLFAVHTNGQVYAIFSSANEALAYWRGEDDEGRRYFHIENAAGQRVNVQPGGSPGHAHAILATLERKRK